MQTNCELSKNNRYSRGYLYSNREIKTIYLVNEFNDNINVSIKNGFISFESDNVYVNQCGSITKKSKLPFSINAFKQYQHLYGKLKVLAKLLDEIYKNNNYKIEPFTISIKLYLTITGNPMKTVIDYNNEYRKENTAIYRKLKSHVVFN